MGCNCSGLHGSFGAGRSARYLIGLRQRPRLAIAIATSTGVRMHEGSSPTGSGPVVIAITSLF